MNTEFQLALTERFEDHSLDVYRDKCGEMYFTREQIGTVLEYQNPSESITNIHARNKEFLDKFSTHIKLIGVDGKVREHTVYGFKGFMAICRYSNQPVADRVMEFLIDLADRVRRGETIRENLIQTITANGNSFVIPVEHAFSITVSKTGCVTVRAKPPKQITAAARRSPGRPRKKDEDFPSWDDTWADEPVDPLTQEIRRFVKECCVFDARRVTASEELFAAWCRWSKIKISNATFFRRMLTWARTIGRIGRVQRYRGKKEGGARFWAYRGIGLAESEPLPPEAGGPITIEHNGVEHRIA